MRLRAILPSGRVHLRRISRSVKVQDSPPTSNSHCSDPPLITFFPCSTRKERWSPAVRLLFALHIRQLVLDAIVTFLAGPTDDSISMTARSCLSQFGVRYDKPSPATTHHWPREGRYVVGRFDSRCRGIAYCMRYCSLRAGVSHYHGYGAAALGNRLVIVPPLAGWCWGRPPALPG